MKAVWCDRPQEADALTWTDVPVPEPGPGEVLIQVGAFGLNRADLEQRKGKYPPPQGTPPILGLEVAGTVAQVGPGCVRFQPGDPVMSLLSGGGYAEFAVATEALCFAVPEGMAIPEAAGLPEAMMVAELALFHLGRVTPDARVLLHGGASGITSFAIALCRALEMKVATTVSTPEKAAWARGLGADLVIPYRTESFSEQIQGDPRFREVDFILDFVGAEIFEKNLTCLARFGSLVLLNCHPGDRGQLPLGRLITGCQSVLGTVLRTRPLEHKILLAKGVKKRMLPLLAAGKIPSIVNHRFTADQVPQAHALMESSAHLGKIIITI